MDQPAAIGALIEVVVAPASRSFCDRELRQRLAFAHAQNFSNAHQLRSPRLHLGFDGDLLEIERYDGALGQLIKNMLNGIIVGAQDQLDKDRKSDRYRKYFGFM